MLNLVNCLNQMGNEFGGLLSYHHFLALVLLQWVCTIIIIIMLDCVDSCVGHSMTWVFLLNLGLALSFCHVLDSVDFVWKFGNGLSNLCLVLGFAWFCEETKPLPLQRLLLQHGTTKVTHPQRSGQKQEIPLPLFEEAGIVMNWTHNPIVHLLADKVQIKLYEREDVGMKVPSLNKKIWVKFCTICSYKIRMGSKYFNYQSKEKTYI